MLHFIIDVLGMALFFGCYAYALSQEPLGGSDGNGPRGGYRSRLMSTAFAAEAELAPAR